MRFERHTTVSKDDKYTNNHSINVKFHVSKWCLCYFCLFYILVFLLHFISITWNMISHTWWWKHVINLKNWPIYIFNDIKYMRVDQKDTLCAYVLTKLYDWHGWFLFWGLACAKKRCHWCHSTVTDGKFAITK